MLSFGIKDLLATGNFEMGSGTLEELLGSDANCDLLSSYWNPGIATYGKAPSKNGLAPSGRISCSHSYFS